MALFGTNENTIELDQCWISSFVCPSEFLVRDVNIFQTMIMDPCIENVHTSPIYIVIVFLMHISIDIKIPKYHPRSRNVSPDIGAHDLQRFGLD